MSSGNFISPTYYFAGVLSPSPSPTKAAWEWGRREVRGSCLLLLCAQWSRDGGREEVKKWGRGEKRAESKRMRHGETKGGGSDFRLWPERANSPANASVSWLLLLTVQTACRRSGVFVRLTESSSRERELSAGVCEYVGGWRDHREGRGQVEVKKCRMGEWLLLLERFLASHSAASATLSLQIHRRPTSPLAFSCCPLVTLTRYGDVNTAQIQSDALI